MRMLGHAPILWPVPSPVLLLNSLGSFSKPVIKAKTLSRFLKTRDQSPEFSYSFSRTIYLKTILTSPRVSGPVHCENQLVHCKQRFTTQVTWPVHMPGIIYYI